jgi:acyl-CoA synthetase (NDP forming)
LRALGTAARIRNPIDLGTLGKWHLLSQVFGELRGRFDGPTVVYAHNAPQPQMMNELAAALIERRAHTSAPVVVLAPGGLRADIEALLVANRIPVFHDTATCFDALACSDAVQPGALGEADVTPDAATTPIDPSIERQLAGSDPLSETASASILRRFGLLLVESKVVESLADALSFAEQSGYPLVLKALAPGVAHKHAAGFVTTGIGSADDLQRAYVALEARIAAAGFERSAAPVILQPMLAATVEIIAGVSWEPGLGHFLVFGFGGVHAELFDEVTLVPIPSSAAAIRAEIEASRVGRLLHATERTPGALVDALVRALDALQSFVTAYGERIASVDVNPLLANGDRLVAVDALIVPR